VTPNARRGRTGKERAGFALLAVIWGSGLIAMLVVSFMTTGRLRLQTAHNIARATEAGLIAEGAINLAILGLLAQRDAAPVQTGNEVVYDGEPRFCVFDGAALAVGIEEESGKVDINAATPELIGMTLIGLGLEPRAAETLAKAIVTFRTPENIGFKPLRTSDDGGPGKAPFDTVLQLDQTPGMEPALLKDLISLTTVHSRSPSVDPRTSPPALFAALAGFPIDEVKGLLAAPYPNALNRKDPRFPANLRQPGDHGAFLVHAEALLATGQSAARDAILDLRPPTGKQFAIKEIRRGQSRYAQQLRAMIASNGAGVPDC
jgi:general secretion pathway protein K